jgi:hypothetical protein
MWLALDSDTSLVVRRCGVVTVWVITLHTLNIIILVIMSDIIIPTTISSDYPMSEL